MQDAGPPNEFPADGTLLTARGVRTRAALLAASRKLFETEGYANTTIADITSEAGRALGSFYTYFDNKEAVLQQLAEDFKNEVDSRVTDLDLTNAEPYDALREVCAVYWYSCKEHAGELAAIFQASMLNECFALAWRSIRADARRNLADGIRSAGDAGLANDPNPEATASALGSMMDYFCYVWLVEGGEADLRSLPDDVAVDTMARVLFRTIFASAEPPTSARTPGPTFDLEPIPEGDNS